MARASIEIKGPAEIKISDAAVTRFRRGIFGFANTVIEKYQKTVVGRMVKSGHQGAYRAVENTLSRGVTPLTGGVKNISYTTGPRGYSGRVRTPSWLPLSERYARENPRSRAFWRKHYGTSRSRGGASPRYTLLYLFNQADRGVSVRSSRPRKDIPSGRGKTYEVSWDLTVNFPGNALGTMISFPFFEAFEGGQLNPVFRYDGPVSRNDVSFIVWVENHDRYGRPFVRPMAFAVGKKTVEAVRQQLLKFRG